MRMDGSVSRVVDESLRLECFDHFPDALMDVPAADLWRHLRGPSLFHLSGPQAEPLFVSVLGCRGWLSRRAAWTGNSIRTNSAQWAASSRSSSRARSSSRRPRSFV